VQDHPWYNLAAGLACTISLGLQMLATDDSTASWLARADHLLYAAKRAGRNRVVVQTA
jgi:PleD family two-component response regulator